MVALLLAWLVPGAGHVYMGRLGRGLIIFVTVGATFWGGIAFGGVMTVHPQDERWWFAAQMLAGVHGVVSWRRQDSAAKLAATQPAVYANLASPKNLALVYPSDTVARAYSGVAGLLNVLCVFDALMLALAGAMGEPPPPSEGQGQAEEAT